MLLINRTLLKLSKGLWGWIATITGLKLLSLVGISFFAQTVSGFLGSLYQPQITAAAVGSAIWGAFFAALMMLGAELLIGEAEYRCTAQARQSLRTRMFSKTLELDVGNIEKVGPVSAVTTSVDGVEAMQVYYSKYLPGVLYAIVAPFYIFFQMKTSSFPSALFLLCISSLIMPLNNLFREKIDRLKKNYWGGMEDLTGYYLESVRGLTTIKLFGQDKRRAGILRQKADRFNRQIMAVMKVNFASFLLTDGLIYGSMLVTLIIVCTQLATGKISFSAALSVFMLSFGFFGSIRQLMGAAHTAMAAVAASDRVSALLSMDTKRLLQDRDTTQETGITMKDVFYGYEGRGTALRDISLTIPKGKITALVGQSGCGKSTVAGLLMRFFDPQKGTIRCEGEAYLSLPPEKLRQHIIMVPQTVSLFSGTLESNLRMAAPEASPQELWQTLEDVRLADWARSMPRGLQTDVGDAGAKLSGGQRQKIGIARALLSHAPYIIFDEATSNVDVESEREIWNCINQLALTRTLIIISHRLSTIQNADLIYVLSGGQIAEKGNHRQLMAENGLYRRLVEEQAVLESRGEEQWSHVL